jgi:pimeloyl-ACP methyl ester carboxylesterase
MKKLSLKWKLILFFGIFLHATFAMASSEKITLDTVDGLSFDVVVTEASSPRATVIYVPGLGGDGNEIQKLNERFASENLNLVSFDRDEPPCEGFKCFMTVGNRVPSGQPIYSPDQQSALDHIVANEMVTVMSFITSSQFYQKAPKIFLIGGSYGAWVSLQAASTPELSNYVHGAVFVSPSIAPHKSTGEYAKEMIRFEKIKTA